ncbi:MAG TPA: hypothetical protein VMU67_00565 [Steroidobacteraceae bacterium]|nr:hypothetical protein [Steroidobacteraceae bacterium]
MKLLSRRSLAQLTALQASVTEFAARRSTALRLFVASRQAATVYAQREFWMEFSWHHQEYRIAVQRLARFCLAHQGALERTARAQQLRESS